MYGVVGYMPDQGNAESDYEYLKRIEKLIDEQQKAQ